MEIEREEEEEEEKIVGGGWGDGRIIGQFDGRRKYQKKRERERE